ncbi:LysR family transcriptional regulator [Aureimonas endophytica]|uniref:LysR family transcriptional regulator n=1 Tax=Aureimonas endophytica TaxID=2027858 RepID=A0A916ZSD8_9HYPH|nr:LysR family transcriptional regulator [Aureimonas endophytica]GGE10574.1 LysR family transcriptional regulator [Aureimonas endophytica]
MQTPRRFLPSIGLLSAFEASARTGSFTAAARELNLTQSAISRQIRALEEQLGVELFLRERQTVRLTPAGEAYARDIREALRRISTASLNLRANPCGGTLNLAILPTFGTRWLAPRLPDFLARHPGITINLATRLVEFDFRLDNMDAAVHFGAPNWQGTHHMTLMAEEVVPMASPDFVASHPVDGDPSRLRALSLLHITSRPDAWEQWFIANDVPAEGVTGMLFDQFATMAQAAMAGLGVALLPTVLVAKEIERGELVPIIERPMRSAENYHLVWPRERDRFPPLVAFRQWLRGATGGASQSEA